MQKQIDALNALIKDPSLYKTQQPLPYSQFIQMASVTIDPQLAASRYDQYKANYEEHAAKLFFTLHKQDEWFLQKYDPARERSDQRQRQLENLKVVVKDFTDGSLDDLSLDVLGPPLWLQPIEDAGPQADGVEGEGRLKIDARAVNYETNFASVKSSEDDDLRTREPTVILGTLHWSITYEQLLQVFKDDPDFKYLVIGEPLIAKNLQRSAWVVLNRDAVPEFIAKYNMTIMNIKERKQTLSEEPQQEVTADVLCDPSQEDDELVDVEYEIRLFPLEKAHFARVLYTPSISNTEQRLEHDLQQCLKLVQLLLSHDHDLKGQVDKLLQAFGQFEVKKNLDLVIVLLRRVFYWDYYSGQRGTSSAQDFLYQFGCRHRRGDPLRQDESFSLAFVSKLDAFYDKILKPSKGASSQELTTTNGLLEQYIEAKIVKIDEEKFRCGVASCGKLFKGAQFVHKHLQNKHTAILEQYKHYIAIWFNYLADPLKFDLNDTPSTTAQNLKRINYKQIAIQQQADKESIANSVFRRLEGSEAVEFDEIGAPLPSQRQQQRPAPYAHKKSNNDRSQSQPGPIRSHNNNKRSSYRDLDNVKPQEDVMDINYG